MYLKKLYFEIAEMWCIMSGVRPGGERNGYLPSAGPHFWSMLSMWKEGGPARG